MQNLDVFNFATLEIFHRCIENFPIDVEIDPTQIALAVADYFEVPKSAEETFTHFSNLDQICMHAVWWLRDEGFVRTKSEMMSGTSSVIITQKGLNALNSSPSILENKKSFKDLFYAGLTNLPFNVASGVMTEFFKSSS